MDTEIITKEQFGQTSETPKGCLDGTFADAQEYLGWVLRQTRASDENNFDKVLKVFQDRFKMPYFTTKYLRGLMTSNSDYKNDRVSYVIKKAGYGTESTKRYFRQMMWLQREIKNIVYANKDGSLNFTERTEKVGGLYNAFVGETLFKIVPRTELDKAMDKNRLLNMFLQFSEIGKTMFSKSKIITFQDKKMDYQTEKAKEIRLDKAIRKLKQKERQFVEVNCKICKHLIKIPVYEKEDKIGETYLVDIMTKLTQDIKDGISFCKDCKKIEEGNWYNEAIKNFLLNIIETHQIEEGVKFKAQDFSTDYRVDKEPKSAGYVREVIMDLMLNCNLDDKLKVITNNDFVKIQVIKKD